MSINQRILIIFSFPLIAFNHLQGSIHTLFNADNLEHLSIKMKALFRNSVVTFTELYEKYWQKIEQKTLPDFRELSEKATKNSFLKDLDYPTFYLSRLMNLEDFQRYSQKHLVKSDKDSVFRKIAQLIGSGETAKALDALEEFALGKDIELYRQAIINKSQLAELNKEKICHTITNEKYRTELNKINFAILSSLNF